MLLYDSFTLQRKASVRPVRLGDYVLDQIIAPCVSINVEKEEYEMSISEQVSLYSTLLFRNIHAHKRISIIILHI